MGKVNKVGKITVKHYLNTSIKRKGKNPEDIEYPVYVQITANRKTTQIRSLTNIYFLEKEFDEYISNPSSFDIDMTVMGANLKDGIKVMKRWRVDELQIELETVEKIIEYCIRKKGLEIGEFPTSEVIEFYSLYLDREFGSYINDFIDTPGFLLNYEETGPIERFLMMDNNPYELLTAIKEVTNFDIFEKLSTKHKDIIHSFNEFLINSKSYAPSMLIDWYNGDLKKNYLINSKKDKTDGYKYIIELLEVIALKVEYKFWSKLAKN